MHNKAVKTSNTANSKPELFEKARLYYKSIVEQTPSSTLILKDKKSKSTTKSAKTDTLLQDQKVKNTQNVKATGRSSAGRRLRS